MQNQDCLQSIYASKSICFGCGPANKNGLQIQSYVKGDQVICNWMPSLSHQAFPGILNGGIISSILDCHSNWAAAYFFMHFLELDYPQCSVTGKFTVSFLKPTDSLKSVFIVSDLVQISDRKSKIHSQLFSDDELNVDFIGTFIRVKSSHPAYNQWFNH